MAQLARLIVITVLVLMSLQPANAQSGDPRGSAYGGASGFFGPGTGYVNRIPSNSNVRPINISPSGRLYDTEAPTYLKATPKVQRKSKRR
jgi:hypothetical protein